VWLLCTPLLRFLLSFSCCALATRQLRQFDNASGLSPRLSILLFLRWLTLLVGILMLTRPIFSRLSYTASCQNYKIRIFSF